MSTAFFGRLFGRAGDGFAAEGFPVFGQDIFGAPRVQLVAVECAEGQGGADTQGSLPAPRFGLSWLRSLST